MIGLNTDLEVLPIPPLIFTLSNVQNWTLGHSGLETKQYTGHLKQSWGASIMIL